jgi:hypothetical protein
MLMKDPGRRWWEREPYQLPGPAWPYWLLVAGILLVVALSAIFAPLSGPQSRCTRPVAYQVHVRAFTALCGTTVLHRLAPGR